MTTNTATIEIQRFVEESESTRAYEMRVAYLTMGGGRSLERLRQKYGKNTSYLRQLQEWSSQYHWQDQARIYDEQQASILASAHTEQYRADLEDHRKRYQQRGRDLDKLAYAMMARLSAQLNATGGKATTIKDSEIPTALRTISTVLTTAADLEAHALRLEELMPRLTSNDSE